MARLTKYLKDLVSLSGALLSIVAILVPTASTWAPSTRALTPPWPGQTTAPLLATLASVFVALAVIAIFGNEPDAVHRRSYRKAAKQCLALGIVLAAIFLTLAAFLIKGVGNPPFFTVTGFGWREEALSGMSAGNVVPHDIESCLEWAGYATPQRCWRWHDAAKLCVFSTYVATLCAWTASFAFAIVSHEARTESPSASERGEDET